MIEIARSNAAAAKVAAGISFSAGRFEDAAKSPDSGFVICNPPYGVRIGEAEDLQAIYAKLAEFLRPKRSAAFYVLTADELFEKSVKRRADKRRKLYNGRIRVDLYQYFAENS